MAKPSVGVIARLLLKEMKRDKAQYNRILKSILRDTETTAKGVTKATKGMTNSFDEFTKSSKAMLDILNKLKPEESIRIFQELSIAFKNLGEGAQINIEKFDELVRSGTETSDAFRQATTTTDELAEAKRRLAESDKAWLVTLGQITTAIAGVTAVLKIAQREFREAIESYRDLGEETRRIVLQTGLAIEEASIWAKTAELQNVSARSLAAGFAQVSRNLTNMQLRLAAGKEDNTNFARTLRALRVDVRDAEGNFKSTLEIITEVNEKIRELGPGWQAAGITQNVYGRGAASLLPIILDQAVSIEEVTKLMNEQNAAMTRLDREGLDKVRKAEARLLIARQAGAAVLGREYIPFQAALINQYASILEFVIKIDKQVRAFGAGVKALINPVLGFFREYREIAKGIADDESLPLAIRAAIGPFQALQQTFKRIKEEGLEVTTFWEAYQEELNKLNGVVEEAIDAENKLTKERNEALDALFAETGGTEELNKSLKEQAKIMQDLTDAWDDYQDRRVDIGRRFDDQLEDLEIRQGREQITRGLKQGFALEDIHIKRAQRLRDLTVDLSNKQAALQRDLNRKLEDFEKSATRAREKIAVKHRENLLKIENRFFDTVEEAARTNDTVAVVRAIRRRNREQRDETRRFSVEQQELEKDLKLKRDKIRDDAKVREEEEKQRADERRARIEQQFKDEIDALIRKSERELVLSRKKDRERRQDIERNRAQALRDAKIFYRREEDELRQHQARIDSIIRSGIQTSTQMIAMEVDNGLQVISTALKAAMARAATEFIGGGLLRPGTGGSEFIGGGFSRPLTGQPIDQWLRGRTPGGYRAHGGMDIVNRPTTYTAGEAGAEIAAFIPLSNNRNINHSFGKLPIDINGLPGGMDTSQIQTIVYSAMIELARVLGTARR